jgi:hypothetical protein
MRPASFSIETSPRRYGVLPNPGSSVSHEIRHADPVLPTVVIRFFYEASVNWQAQSGRRQDYARMDRFSVWYFSISGWASHPICRWLLAYGSYAASPQKHSQFASSHVDCFALATVAFMSVSDTTAQHQTP